MKSRIILFVAFLVMLTGNLRTQSLFENASDVSDTDKLVIDFNGYGRGSAYGGSENYDYSSVFAEFGIQGELSLNKAFLFTDLRFRAGTQFDSLYARFQLKETYAGYQSDKIDIYFGAKIVSWGRMDGFNPTDNITPYDYFFLSADPDDQKLPNMLLQTKWYITPNIDFELVLIPIYRPSIYRYDLFDLGEYTSFTNPTLPERTFNNGSVGAKLNFNLAKAGFSISYFQGFDPYYGFNLYDISWDGFVPSIELSSQPYKKNTIGTDFSVPLSSWIIRGEVAYNMTNNYTENMYIPNPGIEYVAGVEHQFWGITTILQYIGQYTLDFTPLDDQPDIGNPNEMIMSELTAFNRKIFNQQEKTNHAFSLSLSRSFAYETLSIEAIGYYNLTSEEWLVRPKLNWKITDHLETGIGGFYSTGPDESIFSYASKVLNGAFIELRVSF
ncbi:MAG: hypothetical protein KQH67_08875 [Bacteroidetes bacterium]|nr:hypothetical protein [Bacteroidota bacterium]